MRHRIELLAPAGSLESLKGAVNAGADAVYIGAERFSARAYADNPDEKELIAGIRYAHLHDCDVYLTINTLFKEREIEELGGFLKPYYESGLDAVIVQDMGVLSYIRGRFKDLDIHASTQMTVTGEDAAAFLKKQGVKRVVTARELSLPEIRRIHESVGIEIESFIHGALCYCYSGQCLFSSMLGGRSGNRGRCAQPCRLPYRLTDSGSKNAAVLNRKDEPYLLSPRDLCAIELIPEILDAGVCSLKIEGRMKRPAYTAGVVAIYRKYLDRYLEGRPGGCHVEKEDYEKLLLLYNRQGFSEGYYRHHNGRELISLKNPKHFDEGASDLKEKQEYEALIKQIENEYLDCEKKEGINGSFTAVSSKPAQLTVSCRGVEVRIEEEPFDEAVSVPASQEEIERRLRKTGNTPFEFERLDINTDGKVFCPAGRLNRMRREALEELSRRLVDSGKREPLKDLVTACILSHPEAEGTVGGGPRLGVNAPPAGVKDRVPLINVRIPDAGLLDTVLSFDGVDGVCLDCAGISSGELKNAVERCHTAGKSFTLAMPPIFRLAQRKSVLERAGEIREAAPDGILVKNVDEAAFAIEHFKEIPITADHSLYTWNGLSREFWREAGIAGDTAPLELNCGELETRGLEGSDLIVYGRIPLMTTAGCLKKTVGCCDHKEELLYLEDRYRVKFPVKNSCAVCCNTIYNSVPLSLLGLASKVGELHPRSISLIFTTEGKKEAHGIIASFIREYAHGGDGKTKDGVPAAGTYTRGHFKRGVI